MSPERPDSFPFTKDQSYDDVFFMLVDASGHSGIVRTNPPQAVDKLFDHLEESIRHTVRQHCDLKGCQYADFWGWQGDGGLCIIYDHADSSRAAHTAIGSAIAILEQLPALQKRVKELGVNGEVHIRIALHKGGFRYKGSDRHGSIHAKALNFAAHLEKVSPRDCIAISTESLEQYADLSSKFTKFKFPFEEQSVSIYAPKKREIDAKRAWMMAVPIQDSFMPNVIIHRPEEVNKTAMIETARKDVLDFGTALRTCSRYLEPTRAPFHYRNEVLRLLEQGIPYTCLILNPQSDVARRYGRMRAENLVKKTRESLGRLQEFAREVEAQGLLGEFRVCAYSDMPYFACIGIDRDRPDGLLVFSPYMPSAKGLEIGRAETMHMLLRREKASAALYDQINRCITFYLGRAKTIISSRPKGRK